MVCRIRMERDFSPVLGVAASLDCGGGDVGSVNLGLCLWAQISTSSWMVPWNLIKNINLLAAKAVCKKERRWDSHLCSRSLHLLTVEVGTWLMAA